MLVDSHCHLDFDVFEDDFDGVLTRASDAGVGTMVTICTQLSRFPDVLRLAETYANIWCSVGVHPHEAAEEGVDDPQTLVELADHPRVVGIGETGLDYYYEHSPARRPGKPAFAPILRRRERPGCRLSSTPAMPMWTPCEFCGRRRPGARFRA